VHFAGPHRDDQFPFRGGQIRGDDLAVTVRRELIERLTGPAAPYNSIFTTNGIACSTATIITATLGHRDLSSLTLEHIETIKQVHLVLAMFNALQPGVFAISGWDLRGVLVLNPSSIGGLLEDGDTRWLNRGAYDMMGVNPEANSSLSGMPKAPCLYGSLSEQLTDPNSFASQLKAILAVREKQGLALAKQLDIPILSNHAILALVHQLPADSGVQATVLYNLVSHTYRHLRRDHGWSPQRARAGLLAIALDGVSA